MRKNRKLAKAICVTFLTIFCCSARLTAEIEAITIKWFAQECQTSCPQNLLQRFLAMPGAAEILMNANDGQAIIRWKPYVPFSFSYINDAMRLAGPRLKDARIKVRGTVSGSGSNFVLRSLGDNTQFTLIGPTQPSLTQYVEQNSLESHVLNPEAIQRFAEAQQNNVVVAIEGTLFLPTRYTGLGLYLIVESASFARLGQGAIPGSP